MSELDDLRRENTALKFSAEICDVATAGMLEATVVSIAMLHKLQNRLADDPNAVTAIAECATIWKALIDAISERCGDQLNPDKTKTQ